MFAGWQIIELIIRKPSMWRSNHRPPAQRTSSPAPRLAPRPRAPPGAHARRRRGACTAHPPARRRPRRRCGGRRARRRPPRARDPAGCGRRPSPGAAAPPARAPAAAVTARPGPHPGKAARGRPGAFGRRRPPARGPALADASAGRTRRWLGCAFVPRRRQRARWLRPHRIAMTSATPCPRLCRPPRPGRSAPPPARQTSAARTALSEARGRASSRPARCSRRGVSWKPSSQASATHPAFLHDRPYKELGAAPAGGRPGAAGAASAGSRPASAPASAAPAPGTAPAARPPRPPAARPCS